MSSASGQLRVRTKRDYHVPYVVNLGQRDVSFLERPWTPLQRLFEWADAFTILPERDYDIVHAINAVPLLSRRPFIVSFEDFLPRVPEDRHIASLERVLQRALLSERCTALLAMSEYAQRQFRHQNRGFAGRARLEEKMTVRYPAVASRRLTPKPELGSEELKLLFVGRDFMRKGAPAVLRSHEQLRAKAIPVRTTIVSSLRWQANDAYVDPPSERLVARTRARIDQPGVEHFNELPLQRVLELMEEADFLVLPTLHDTFGFVVLEALACGTPVIASATNALPELIEDGRNGFLLPLESDGEIGRWAWTYRTRERGFVAAYEAATNSLADAMSERLAACWETPGLYRSLSAGALAIVDERFSVPAARATLEELYAQCNAQTDRARRRPRGLRWRRLPETSGARD
jgi:glycosyltransferase involved in cell wall biosynthesis